MLKDLLQKTIEAGASDLLLVADAPPTIYRSGQWQPLDMPAMDSQSVSGMLEPVLSAEQRERLEKERDLDIAVVVENAGRFRVNVHYQRGGVAAAFRAVPQDVPGFNQLGLPSTILGFGDYPSGLVLITGCTGQGKSTTLAALVDHINQTRAAHIVTIEDPIEFQFAHRKALIEQREIGQDSPTFASALRHILRQRPDVILLGEMRDLETISTALTAAETGHLVLASLHTASTWQTIARIIDAFPPEQQPYVRTQLAASLRAILCQRLLRDVSETALHPATEILTATAAIRRAIRDNETHLIYGMIETGRRHGMHTLEQSLAELVQSGRVDPAEAFSATTEPARLERLIGIDADSVMNPASAAYSRASDLEGAVTGV